MNNKIHKAVVAVIMQFPEKYYNNLRAPVRLEGGNGGMLLASEILVEGSKAWQAENRLTNLLKDIDSYLEEDLKQEVYRILSGLSDGENDYAYFESLLNS